MPVGAFVFHVLLPRGCHTPAFCSPARSGAGGGGFVAVSGERCPEGPAVLWGESLRNEVAG